MSAFDDRLKTVVLFGSRARQEADETSDHDLFIVIDRLPTEPIKRSLEVRSAIREIPLVINTICKTPEEVAYNLTPLLLDVCVDGICLHGLSYFSYYQERAIEALKQSGLKRERENQIWFWKFDQLPNRNWELTWDGYREFS